MKSLSFDGLVEFYNETRDCDPACFDAALNYIEDQFSPLAFGKLFEPGIGTGRIAVPLAQKGYQVTGIDISKKMLILLQERLSQFSPPLPISYQMADVTQVPFAEGVFDIAIAVHLFYFIQDWKKAAEEILRVVSSQGSIILMHTGTGTEIPLLNERYKELCAEQGCSISGIGVKSTREVIDHFQSLGCHIEWIQDRWQWLSHIRLDKALSYLESRAYSFTTFASDEIHWKAIERLKSELQVKRRNLCVKMKVPNQIYLIVIHKG